MKYCPSCGVQNNESKSQTRDDESYPDIYFTDVILLCTNCGLGWHCVGTKKK